MRTKFMLFSKLKNNYDKENSDSEDELLNNKRKRHDTDDEESIGKERHDTEDELNELLPQEDEDGDLIIKEAPITDNTQNHTKTGLFTLKEYQTNKTVKRNVFEEIAKKPVETIYRDKEGRKIKPGETKKDKEKKLKELNEKQLQKWIKGFKQAEDHKRTQEENKEMKNQPLARYEIDKSFEHELKQKERFGDPLKDLINFKNIKNNFEKEEDNLSKTSEGNLKKDLLPQKKQKKND